MDKEISNLYAAAIGEESWQQALDAFRASIGADALLLGAGSFKFPENVEVWVSGDHAAGHIEAGYSDADSWNPEVNPCVGAGAVMPVGRAFEFRKHLPAEVIARSEFLQTTMIRSGFTAGFGYVPLREGTKLAGGFVSKASHGEFDGVETERLNVFIPHLGHALRLREKLALARTVETSLSRLLDRMDVAAFLVDGGLRIQFMNGRAEDLSREDCGVAIVRNRLTLSLAAEVAVLRAIADFRSRDRPGCDAASVAVRRGSGRARCLLRIYPAAGLGSVASVERATAIILAERLDRPPRLPDVANLQIAFELTEREAAVARLLPTGAARRDIGRRLGISENTIKTHIAAILEKTGARNTRELVLVLSGIGPD